MLPQGKYSKTIDLVKAAAQGHSRSPSLRGNRGSLQGILCSVNNTMLNCRAQEEAGDGEEEEEKVDKSDLEPFSHFFPQTCLSSSYTSG